CFACMRPLLSLSALFPYTTLFRSEGEIIDLELFDGELEIFTVFLRDGGRRCLGAGKVETLAIAQDAALFDTRDHLGLGGILDAEDRKSTRLNSSHVKISYAVFCLK